MNERKLEKALNDFSPEISKRKKIMKDLQKSSGFEVFLLSPNGSELIKEEVVPEDSFIHHYDLHEDKKIFTDKISNSRLTFTPFTESQPDFIKPSVSPISGQPKPTIPGLPISNNHSNKVVSLVKSPIHNVDTNQLICVKIYEDTNILQDTIKPNVVTEIVSHLDFDGKLRHAWQESDDELVKYIVSPLGRRGRPRLVDSLGFSYNFLRRLQNGHSRWQCCLHSTHRCPAQVRQISDDTFTQISSHSHYGTTGLLEKTCFMLTALEKSEESPNLSSANIVDSLIEEYQASGRLCFEFNRQSLIQRLEKLINPSSIKSKKQEFSGEDLAIHSSVRYMIAPLGRGGRQRLYDSLGYSYNCLRRLKNGDVRWQCCRHSQFRCSATIIQKHSRQFVPSKAGHSHPGQQGLIHNTRILINCLERGERDMDASAHNIVEQTQKEMRESGVEMKSVDSLARRVNRWRASLRSSRSKNKQMSNLSTT